MSWVAGIKEKQIEAEVNLILQTLAEMDAAELAEAERLAAKDPNALLTFLNDKYSITLNSVGSKGFGEYLLTSDLYVDLLWEISPVYNAHYKFVNILSAFGPVMMEFNTVNMLPTLYQGKEITGADVDAIMQSELYQSWLFQIS